MDGEQRGRVTGVGQWEGSRGEVWARDSLSQGWSCDIFCPMGKRGKCVRRRACEGLWSVPAAAWDGEDGEGRAAAPCRALGAAEPHRRPDAAHE